MDLWTTLNPIAAPAAGDRMMLGTGPNAGGYSERREFAFRSGAGEYTIEGPTLPTAQFPTLKFLRPGIGYWEIGYDGTPGSNAFALRVNGGAPLMTTGPGLNSIGIGVTPAAKLHVKSATEIARFETTTVRGSGNGYIGIADPTGRKFFLGYGGGDDSCYLFNEMNSNLLLGTSGTIRMVVGSPATALAVWSGADNAYSLGLGGNRWSVLYAASGTINTCDVRLKFYRPEPAPTPDEHAAALDCFDAFGFFQYLDAIAREQDGGSAARWHFGPKAQEVWSIFASHGLADALVEDASGDLVPPPGSVPPAFLCFDAWGEETAPVMVWWRPSDILGPDGQPVMVPCDEGEVGTEQRPTGETYVTREAGNIFGIRIDQLQSLMLVALNKERLAQATTIAAQETRLAALEAAA